jgi:hypothetical protein
LGGRFRGSDAQGGRFQFAVLRDGRNVSARYWSNYQTRAWSLMLITYGEVSAAGRWLFRHENGEERFPSL